MADQNERLPEVAPELTGDQVIEAGRTDTDPALRAYYLAAMRQRSAFQNYAEARKVRADDASPLSAAESREYMVLLGMEGNRTTKSPRLQELAVRHHAHHERAQAVGEVAALREEFLTRSAAVERSRAVLEAKAAHQQAAADAAAAVERARAEEAAQAARTKAEIARLRGDDAGSGTRSSTFDAHGNQLTGDPMPRR